MTLKQNCVMELSRRDFLKVGAVAATLPFILPLDSFAADFWSEPRSLHMINSRTKEEVRATYFADGKLIPEEYVKICHVMRDTHVGMTVQMDVVLLDILRGIQGWFGAYGQDRPIHLNSGYRSPQTNAAEGGARNSWHMRGAAADIVIPGVPVDYLTRLALYLQGGGVGIYRDKGFIHVDRGRLRTWRG